MVGARANTFTHCSVGNSGALGINKIQLHVLYKKHNELALAMVTSSISNFGLTLQRHQCRRLYQHHIAENGVLNFLFVV